MNDEKTIKAVEDGVEKSIFSFAKSLKGTARDVNSRLRVIELRVSLGKNRFYLQLIFNPWSYHEFPPIVEINGIDIPPIQTEFYRIEMINKKEGRHRITILDHEQWSVKDWRSDQDATKFCDVVEDVLESLKQNGIVYRNLNLKRSTWELYFPIGIKTHLDRLNKIAKEKNWELVTEKEHKIIQKQKKIEAEKKRIKLDAQISRIELNIEKSEDLEAINSIEEEFTEDVRNHKRFTDIKSKLEKRREKLQPKLEPLNFDNPNFTKDNSMVGEFKKRKKPRRL